MTTAIDHRKNLTVVGVDGSVSARNAVRWAATDVVGRDTTLVLVYAGVDQDITRTGAPGANSGTASGARARAQSALAAARVIALSILGDDADVKTVLDPGPPHEVLNGYADTARMLVLGSRRKGTVARAVLGSVSTDIATHARCPIAVVPQTFTRTATESETAPAVVGVDCSPNDDAVLDVAFDQASRLGVPLRAVHAYESLQPRTGFTRHIDLGPRMRVDSAPQRWIDHLIASWSEKYPDVEATAHATQDRPSHALLDDASHAQLIVLGARSRGAISPLFGGSTSRAVLHRADIPVVIVPACGEKLQ
ncbi:universal stress protein [Rhodococcus sp. ARC_M12]|uniref:universal stress protein n=1 Tax=Rhodococcus sp. ARC_M12 TaxID=2928854 RepID=UPI001FB55D0F|nr:universal stress protein [Rhodococcus sp. ARC_M12]MCJ0979597.1 universal stress protein [Rhodococcus sp. ARC_M12]